MNKADYTHDDNGDHDDGRMASDRVDDTSFKKLKRPLHAAKRSKTPERLRGMHRRRRKRMNW